MTLDLSDIDENHIYTVKELSQLLRISYTKSLKLIKTKKIPSFKIGSEYRITGWNILKIIK